MRINEIVHLHNKRVAQSYFIVNIPLKDINLDQSDNYFICILFLTLDL